MENVDVFEVTFRPDEPVEAFLHPCDAILSKGHGWASTRRRRFVTIELHHCCEQQHLKIIRILLSYSECSQGSDQRKHSSRSSAPPSNKTNKDSSTRNCQQQHASFSQTTVWNRKWFKEV